MALIACSWGCGAPAKSGASFATRNSASPAVEEAAHGGKRHLVRWVGPARRIEIDAVGVMVEAMSSPGPQIEVVTDADEDRDVQVAVAGDRRGVRVRVCARSDESARAEEASWPRVEVRVPAGVRLVMKSVGGGVRLRGANASGSLDVQGSITVAESE